MELVAAGHSKQVYQTYIEKWEDCWKHCTQGGRSHFEGDKSEYAVTALVFLQ